jgi:hypothetical protein
MFVIKKAMTDIKNHDTSPSPALVIGLRNCACATRDVAIALPLNESIRQTHGMLAHTELAYLLGCFVHALKALSLHLKHVLLAFCSLGRRLRESFFGQDPLQREEARSRYAAPRANEAALDPRKPFTIGAKYHVALAALAKWWCCLFLTGGGAALRSGLVAGSLCGTLAERVSKRETRGPRAS